MQDLKLIRDYLDSQNAALIEFRRELHSEPELSFEEHNTTRKISEFLISDGIVSKAFPKTTGLYVDIVSKGAESYPKILLRADIDALPIQDLKTCTYRSKNEGVMHACGHDVHTASVIGALKALNSLKEILKFNIRVVFQPAEELGRGADALIDQGVLEGVSYALAFHVDPTVALGDVAIRPGPINAAVIEFEVRIEGKTAHVARVHQGIDTILPAARLICDSYAHVPKKLDARDPHILYFGKIISGSASNIVSPNATILGTIRAFKSQVAETVYLELQKIGQSIATQTGVTCDISKKISLKAVVNDAAVSDYVLQAATQVVGSEHIIHDLPTSMGGEDFGSIMERVPGAMFRLGVTSKDASVHGLHTPYFDVPESAILTAAEILASSVVHVSSKSM